MLKFSIITFGCQMNEYDSKLIENLLIHDGMVKASDPETAEVVILNTCSVREKPEKKAIETAKYFKKRG
ncbi:MAG: tRNA (N6-isopentenyl adenosine(37)-C2)-methylthiotransferase MiaB, partial [candidate division WOR-3 bacterium]